MAQVNGPGPSPGNLFNTVLNLPGDEAVIAGASRESVGGVPEETIQLNINEDGFVGDDFSALSGSEVNVRGGTVGNGFTAFRFSEVNISGGNVGSFSPAASSVASISGGNVGRFSTRYGVVSISGGTFGPDFKAWDDSDVELIGGEFRLNGAEFSGDTITLAENDVFTGTLADGSSFVFTAEVFIANFIAEFDRLENVTLTTVALPAADLNPILIDSPMVSGPSGLRDGQTLTLQTGGSLPDYFAIVDATLNVEGGTLGEGAEASNSVVNISGGNTGFFNAYSDSVVNISGGNVDRFRAYTGSAANISGGTVGDDFSAVLGSDVELIGGEFRLNGADFPGGVIFLTDDDVFTGTLADGSSFIFSAAASDELITSLTAVALPAADLSPIVINTPVVSGPSGLRAGQTLTLQTGGSLRDNFAAVGATLNVEGGIVGDGAEASDSLINISSGNVGNRFDAFSGSEVNVNGGAVGDNFEAHRGSVVNISGGTLGSFDALSGSEVNISGGDLGEDFDHQPGSVINLLGSEFFIDGEQLDVLLPGDTYTITDQNRRFQPISGFLSDGTPFSLNLKSDFRGGTITVTLVSPPIILGDVNQDGDVNFLDIFPFVGVLSTGRFQTEADIDQNGVLNLLDINLFIGLLSGN